eukprot:5847893-Amphidinium_carterae.1
MPPNPQHAHCLAHQYLLHLAFWLQCATHGLRGGTPDSSVSSSLAKLWIQHGCIASFGIAGEQLTLSSDWWAKQ